MGKKGMCDGGMMGEKGCRHNEMWNYFPVYNSNNFTLLPALISIRSIIWRCKQPEKSWSSFKFLSICQFLVRLADEFQRSKHKHAVWTLKHTDECRDAETADEFEFWFEKRGTVNITNIWQRENTWRLFA